MKTMQLDDKIQRVTEEKARQMFEDGWSFVPKSLWKEKVRDVEKPKEEKPTKKKANKMSRSAKRHARKNKK